VDVKSLTLGGKTTHHSESAIYIIYTRPQKQVTRKKNEILPCTQTMVTYWKIVNYGNKMEKGNFSHTLIQFLYVSRFETKSKLFL